MPARTGQEYITGLRNRPREVWIDGECVKDVTAHPALRNGARTVAGSLRHAARPVASRGDDFRLSHHGRTSRALIHVPKTIEDLERKREMMARWAWASCGMMGRSPDFMNSIFTAWAGSPTTSPKTGPRSSRRHRLPRVHPRKRRYAHSRLGQPAAPPQSQPCRHPER